MCGRYVLYGPHSRLAAYFSLQECPDIAPRYNIAPTSDVLVIRQRPEVGRVGQLVRWGAGAELGEGHQRRREAEQRPCRDGRHEAIIPHQLCQAPVFDPSQRVLRVEARQRGRQGAKAGVLRSPCRGRWLLRLCRTAGAVAFAGWHRSGDDVHYHNGGECGHGAYT